MTSNRDWLMRLAHDAPDELAAWMDAEHEDPTNGIADETNGIHTDAPLVYVDAVKLLREAAGSDVSNLLLINSTSACDVEEAYAKLADMVERDYVPREAYEDLRDEFTWETTFLHRMGKQCGTKDVPSLVAYVDKLEARVEELEAVDRRIAEADSRWEAATRDLERMTAERDEWKAKAEGSSKVRAGSSSAKRAAAVERLKDVRYHTLADYVRAMLGWGHEPHFEDCRDALIDLLTDESCGQDVDQGIRAEAPVRESCTNLDAVREFAARYEQRIEELERLWHAFENEVAAQSVEIAERDKRIVELEDELHRSYNAQSAKAEELTLRGVRIAELQEQVDKLTAERDGWRMRCGKLLDAAHSMQRIADVWEV